MSLALLSLSTPFYSPQMIKVNGEKACHVNTLLKEILLFSANLEIANVCKTFLIGKILSGLNDLGPQNEFSRCKNVILGALKQQGSKLIFDPQMVYIHHLACNHKILTNDQSTANNMIQLHPILRRE